MTTPKMGPLVYIVLGGFLAICACQDEGTTPMDSKPMPPQQTGPNLVLIIVPVATSVICAAVVIVVIILYLRFCHRPGGDKIADAEKGKKTELKTSGLELRANATTDREAETVLNGAKDQLREIQSLSKNLALSVKEFKSLEWHAKSILKFIEEGIYEENEPKTLKDELFAEVNKRVAKDPKDHSDDDDDGTQRKRRIESNRERQNRLYTETNKVLNDGKKFIKEANQRDIEIRNFTKDAKKALVQVKERVRAMKKQPDTKKEGKHGKFGAGEEGKPLLK